MSKRRRRVPPTYKARGVRVEGVEDVLRELATKGAVNYVRMTHEDGCPAIAAARIDLCTCGFVDVVVREVDSNDELRRLYETPTEQL